MEKGVKNMPQKALFNADITGQDKRVVEF